MPPCFVCGLVHLLLVRPTFDVDYIVTFLRTPILEYGSEKRHYSAKYEVVREGRGGEQSCL